MIHPRFDGQEGYDHQLLIYIKEERSRNAASLFFVYMLTTHYLVCLNIDNRPQIIA